MKVGRAPVVLVINDTQWNRLLQEMSFSGSNEQTWYNELTYHSSAESGRRNRDEQEQNIHQNRLNINRQSYDLITENPRKYIRGLCPAKSPALGNFDIFLFLIKSFPKFRSYEIERSWLRFFAYCIYTQEQ